MHPEGEIGWPQIAAFRLARQHLDASEEASPENLSRGACGIQAQVMSAAEMALWARQHSLTRETIHSALWESRRLVKTLAMRGTLHLLPACDLAVYLRALRKSRLRQLHQIMARYGVSRRVSDRVTESVLEVLDGGPLARPDLTERILALQFVKGKAKAWFEQSWWGVTRQAMAEGLVCYGPDQGRSVTLVLTEQWLPPQREIPEREAQRTLFRHYLSSFGPASLQDFSKWAGVQISEARAFRDLLEDELVEFPGGSSRRWLLRRDQEALSESHSGQINLRLLPYFDSYLLGHAPKGPFLDPRHYKRVFRQAGWVSPVVLLNGKVIGVWSLTHHSNRSVLEVEPFNKVSKAIRNLVEKDAESLGRFLGNIIQVTFKA